MDAYLPAALARACKVSGARQLNLVGYCFGGVLVLLSAARHPGLPVRSLATTATPADFSQMPFAELSGIDVNSVVDDAGNVPATVIRQPFRILMPTADAVQYADLLEHLWNDDSLVVYQAMTRWINDQVPFPGAAARQVSEMIVGENGMMQGDRPAGRRLGDAGRHPLPAAQCGGHPRHHRAAGRRPADSRAGGLAGQSRARARRRAHRAGLRPHCRQGDGTQDHRGPAAPERTGRAACRLRS